MAYTQKQSGLSVRKGRGKNEYSVYKHNVALFTGLEGKEFAKKVMLNQYRREAELRK